MKVSFMLHLVPFTKTPSENESSLGFEPCWKHWIFYILITEMLHILSFEKGRAPDDNMAR